jgi:putative restriction endonuclease
MWQRGFQKITDKEPTTDLTTSSQIVADPNVPGFLLTLSGRGIIPPADPDIWPARKYLAEHRREWRL